MRSEVKIPGKGKITSRDFWEKISGGDKTCFPFIFNKIASLKEAFCPAIWHYSCLSISLAKTIFLPLKELGPR